MRKLMRAALRVLVVSGLVLVCVITLQAHAEQQERAQYAAPGRLIDIGGGQRIHVRTWGERTVASDPAIVLDVSASMPLAEWVWVGRGLARNGHFVVAYDRPGMGWSSGAWQPRDAQHAADSLARALVVAEIDPPFVVVAHSYGGFSSRVFAGTNRDVAGLVLLDTTHPDGGGAVNFATAYRLSAWQAHAGFFHLARPTDNSFSSLPPEEQAPTLAVSRWTSHLDAAAEELEAWPTSAAQVRASDLKGLALLVVSGQGPQVHIDLQRDMLSLSARSDFAQIDASHMGMLVREDSAQLTIAQIERFVRNL